MTIRNPYGNKKSFKVGDRVRVRGSRLVRVVAACYGDIRGGVRLNKPVDGLRAWNADELVRIKK